MKKLTTILLTTVLFISCNSDITNNDEIPISQNEYRIKEIMTKKNNELITHIYEYKNDVPSALYELRDGFRSLKIAYQMSNDTLYGTTKILESQKEYNNYIHVVKNGVIQYSAHIEIVDNDQNRFQPISEMFNQYNQENKLESRKKYFGNSTNEYMKKVSYSPKLKIQYIQDETVEEDEIGYENDKIVCIKSKFRKYYAKYEYEGENLIKINYLNYDTEQLETTISLEYNAQNLVSRSLTMHKGQEVETLFQYEHKSSIIPLVVINPLLSYLRN